MEKFGIENLKPVALVGCKFINALGDAAQDGFQKTDALKLIPPLMDLPGVLGNTALIKQEAKDLSVGELKQIADYVATNMDIPQDKIETMVEKAIGVAVSIVEMVELGKAFKTA